MISPLYLLCLLPHFLATAATGSAPCISGTCAYHSGDGSNAAWSVLAINTESPTSLSDITAAAGWDIIECDPYSTGPQDIRLICTDRSKGCDQLFEGGEEHTIIRLPDSCAGGPFARVVKSWTPDDQTVPARLAKRQLDAPVLALTLDFDFSQIPVSNGKVYITATATNSQTQRQAFTSAAAKRSLEPLRHATRSGQGSAAIRDFVEASKKRPVSPVQVQSTTIGGAKGYLSKARNSIGDTTTTTGTVKDFAHPVDHAIQFNNSISKTVHLIDIDESFPVVTATLTCAGNGSRPAFAASIAVTAAVKAKVNAEVGFILTGSIVPPQIDDLAFTSNLHGHVSAAFDLKASVTGTFDTGLIPLSTLGLPGLSIPGILSVGPSISLNTEGKVILGVTTDIKVSSTFDLPQIDLVFPPRHGQSTAQAVPGSMPIKVDVGRSDELKGRVELHIIPRLDIGVKILGGLAETTVYLDVDGSAGVQFTLSTGADHIEGETDDLPVVALEDVDTKFGGTVSADVGVSIDAGATTGLSPFFDQTVSVQLFSKTFPVFKRTYGDPATKRSLLLEERSIPFPGLTCPLSGEINIGQPILDLDAPAPQP